MPQFLDSAHGTRVAYEKSPGRSPTVIFCGGYLSDMTGTKAMALEAHCQQRGQAFLRFDYGGHGASSGDFQNGTIGDWRADTLAVIDQVTDGPIVLAGSSMGGWIALLAAIARPERVAGLLLLAAAPDFTDRILWDTFDEETRQRLQAEGRIEMPSDYDEPYIFTWKFIEEGRRHLLLGSEIALDIPVRLIHGMKDRDVPHELALEIVAKLTSEDVELTYLKESGHNLSEPDDLARICSTLDRLLNIAGDIQSDV